MGMNLVSTGVMTSNVACRGAVGLVKSREKTIANDGNYAMAQAA